MNHPITFDEFFELGLPDTSSPFITPESRYLSRHLKLRASFLAALLLVCAFIAPWLHVPSSLFLIVVYFLVGVPALIDAVEDLSLLDVNIDVLMTLAAFSSVFIGGALEGGLLLVLFSLSGSLEETVSFKAKGAIRSLRQLAPKKGLVLRPDGTTREKAVQDIPVGAKILIRSGEMVPLDGVVLEGATHLSLVHLTGEAQPVRKQKGDLVPAGAITHEGVLTLEVTATSYDSTLARIIHLVTEAQEAKPTLQRWFDHFSKGYSITIISLFVFFAGTLPFLFGLAFLGPGGSIYRSLSFLIAASPCALILAIPIAYLSAISSLAKSGILLKGGSTFDALLKTQAIAFDKTGTLTTGELQLVGIEAVNDTAIEALQVAFSLERGATHPIARAIVKEAEKQGISPLSIEEFATLPGYGLRATWNGKRIYIGNPLYFEGTLQQRLLERIEGYRQQGEMVSVLLVDQDLFLFRFTDDLRPDLLQLMTTLRKKFKYTLYLLTGDHEANGQLVGTKIGIERVFSNWRPEVKLAHVSALSEGEGLIMVGDGINDAPALARATVGIAMGKVGSGAALDASDIILLQDNLNLLPILLEKAHLTKRIVIQNLSLAITAIIFASALSLLGWIPLWAAVVFHEGGTVLVGLNALRLIKTAK
jgi:heavy metal translocating P-type ATPase